MRSESDHNSPTSINGSFSALGKGREQDYKHWGGGEENKTKTQ